MADSSGSSGVPDYIAEGQSQKEVTANGYFDASSPSILFGRRASTTGLLTWGFYGGEMLVDGVLTAISNSSFALTARIHRRPNPALRGCDKRHHRD